VEREKEERLGSPSARGPSEASLEVLESDEGADGLEECGNEEGFYRHDSAAALDVRGYDSDYWDEGCPGASVESGREMDESFSHSHSHSSMDINTSALGPNLSRPRFRLPAVAVAAVEAVGMGVGEMEDGDGDEDGVFGWDEEYEDVHGVGDGDGVKGSGKVRNTPFPISIPFLQVVHLIISFYFSFFWGAACM
jgi:hypothetical protein